MFGQLAYASHRPADPFMGRIIQLRADLAIKREDYRNAFRCAARLSGRAHAEAKANAGRLQRQAAELAMELAMLPGGR
jgi:hypothetical protein